MEVSEVVTIGHKRAFEQDAQTAKPVRPAIPKRKSAILFGYCGSGYQGMQLNRNARTIEAELWSACCGAGLISAENAVDPKKVAWMRSCRTDKGVHAAAQVVSLKLLVDGSAQELVQKLNEKLPKCIRVYDVVRTANSFHAKERCSSRIYEYLLPTYVFRRRSEDEIERLVAEKQPKSTSHRETDLSDDLANSSDDALSSTDSSKPEGDGLRPADHDEHVPNPKANSKWIKYTSPPTDDEVAAMREYRVQAETLAMIRNFVKGYVGTHDYHNFTIGAAFGAQNSQRYIIDMTASEPFLRDGLEWISIRVHGQAFMLHQIRKMVGLLIMATSLGSTPDIIKKCFAASKFNVPKAPSLGLLLEQPIFAAYNKKFSERDSIDFTRYAEQIQQVKDSLIYPQIFQVEEKTFEFWKWLKCTEDHFYDFKYILPSKVL